MIPHYLKLFTVIWITVYFIPLVNAHFRMRHSFSCWSQVTSHLIASIPFQMACVIVYNSICFKNDKQERLITMTHPEPFKFLTMLADNKLLDNVNII